MNDWKTVRLGDVCEILNGYAFDSKLFNSNNNGTPLIRIRDVVRGFSETYTTELADDKFLVRKGDLLIGMDGEFNCSPWNSEPSYLNQRVCKLCFIADSYDKKYVFYSLHKKLKEIEDKTAFVTVKHISSKQISDIAIINRPLNEQRHIAFVLEKCTELITKYKRMLEKYDALIKSRFIEMFSSQKESFPFCTLDTVSSRIFAGGDRPKETSETKNDEFQYPVFANAETNKGLLCYSKTYQVELPCVTIAARGCTVGYTEVRNEKFTPVVRLLTIIPSKEITPLFLKYYLDLEMKIEGNGAAQPQLTVPTVKKYQIYVPSLTLQNDFATFVHQIDKSKFVVQKSLEKAETLYKSLMQEYFG